MRWPLAMRIVFAPVHSTVPWLFSEPANARSAVPTIRRMPLVAMVVAPLIVPPVHWTLPLRV
ncbi:MAG: hypothetical protein MUC91_00965 [Verrucomicrobia bacterium]|nr:hypothetical protein [Verrucomicrobiota bacterium]